MWTNGSRQRHNRDKLRYPSDLTGAEWAEVAALIPPGSTAYGYFQRWDHDGTLGKVHCARY